MVVILQKVQRKRPGSIPSTTPHTGLSQPLAFQRNLHEQMSGQKIYTVSCPKISVMFHGYFRMLRDRSIHINCKSLLKSVIIAVLTLACKYTCKSFLKSKRGTNILTYSLNINGIVTCIRILSVRIAVETLKTLRLLRMRRDPVWVRMHCDRLKQWPWLPWMESFLQKLPFFFCVFPITFSQVLTIGHQSCL